MRSQFLHGLVGLSDLAMLHEPTWRLRAEENSDHEDEGRDEGRTELESPGNVAGVFHDDIGAEAQENACQ